MYSIGMHLISISIKRKLTIQKLLIFNTSYMPGASVECFSKVALNTERGATGYRCNREGCEEALYTFTCTLCEALTWVNSSWTYAGTACIVVCVQRLDFLLFIIESIWSFFTERAVSLFLKSASCASLSLMANTSVQVCIIAF